MKESFLKKFLLITVVLCYSLWAKETFILALHSYHESYPWTKAQRTGFRGTLDAVPGLYPLYSAEYLDTKRRLFDQEYEDEFLHYMRSKYKGYYPDIIYVTDDNALKFMIDNREKLFPGAPVIFSGINNQETIKKLPKASYTGISETKEISPNIQLIQKLFPHDHRLLILGDGSSTSKAIYAEIAHDLPAVRGINIQEVNEANLDSAIRQLKAYKGKNIILTSIGGFHSENGALIPLREAIETIVHAGNFQIFSLEDTFILDGVIGGHADSGFDQGKAAAQTVLQILSHPSSPLPDVRDDTHGWIFDVKALTQHAITLPEDIARESTFLNQPESFYQKHEELITNSIYGLLATILIGGMVFTRYLYKSRQIISKREDELISISESLNKAQEIAHLGNWTWDIQANTLWWSDEIYRIFGLQPQEFKANYEAFLLRVHPDDREAVQEAVNHSLTDRSKYSIVHRLIKMDGTVRHVLEEGYVEYKDNEPLKMLGTVQDITEDIEKEEVLLMQAQIFDAVQDSIIVHDLEGRFIYLNENAWKTRGYTHDEMMGMSVKELDAPEYTNGHPEKMKAAMGQMREQGHMKVRVEHMCKNGDRLPVEIYAKLIELHNKTYVLSSVRDITDQLLAQKALEESENKYKTLVENAMVGVYRSDLSGNILYVNPALVKMFGYDSPNELIGHKSMMTYRDLKQRVEFIQKLSEAHFVSNYELDLLDHNSNPLPILISATLDGNILSGMIIDMREIKKSREEVDKLSKVVEQIDDTVAITDKRGVISYVNKAFCKNTGYREDEILGNTSRLFKSGSHNNEFYQELWTTILSGEVFRNTLINKKKNGDLFYEKKTISPLRDDKKNIVGFISSGKDVTLETLMHHEIERIATIDKLTGIYNRHKFEELFTLEAERSRRFSQPLSLILIDIDHFKLVNDTHGHDIGDIVLKKLVEIVQANIRKIDIFARWGGEEFLVLSPTTDLANIQFLAEKLRAAVESSTFPEVNRITISMGVSTLGETDTFSELFKRADQGLYYAKEQGRNQVGVVL